MHQLGNLAWCTHHGWLGSNHRAIRNGGSLAYSRLLAVTLLSHNRGASSVGVSVHTLDSCQKLGVDRLDAGAINGLNCSLHLAFVNLFECVERIIGYLSARRTLSLRFIG